MVKQVNLPDFKEMMVLASYLALKDFDSERLVLGKDDSPQEVTEVMDSAIEAISDQFSKDFKHYLETIAYRELNKVLSGQ